MKIKIELAAEWARLKKSSSVLLSGLFALLFSIPDSITWAWQHVPDDLKSAIPANYTKAIAAAAFVLIFLARIYRVRFLKAGDPPDAAQ